jgi:thioester reductase-like protein
VRASSDAAALERLRTALSAVGDFDLARVAAIAGDLSRPAFGLSPERMAEVADAVGAVYHVGAEIDWTKPYSSLRDTNVGGTREAIRLGCAAGAPLHHVSTVGVFALAEDARLPFPEDRDLTDGDRLSLGYSQSKWVAEKMLEHARARGLQVSVYRPSFISGDSRTGAEADSEHQLFYAFLASCVRTGEAPALEKVIDVVPVDWAAEAIAALSLDARARGKRFNLKNPSPLRQRRLYDVVRERGWPLREVAYARWRDQVLSLRKDDPLARFAIFYRVMDEKRMARLEAQMAESLPVEDTQARSLLDAMGLRCPPLDSCLLETYFSYYVQRGLLPLPEVRAPHAASARAEGPEAGLRALSLPPPLEPKEPKLWALYGKNKAKQWDAATRIDWSIDVDPENPLDLPDSALPLFGSDVLRRMTSKEQGAVRRHYQAWQLSQFMFGEQMALHGAAMLIERAPTIEAQMYAATQAGDEARHLEIYTRLVDEKFGLSYPLVEPLRRLAGQIVSDNRWDMKALGIQVLIEGFALGNFAALRDQSRNPLIASVHAYVVEDEARHVAFGRRLLAPYYAELTDGERAEREEFVVEASYLLRDRMLATEAVWEALGVPVDECQRWIRESGYQRAWASTLFSRIVPTIRAVGLWGVKVQQAYSKMGVLGYGDSSLEELTAQDELRAAALGESHAS